MSHWLKHEDKKLRLSVQWDEWFGLGSLFKQSSVIKKVWCSKVRSHSPGLTWMFRSAPFFVRSSMIWCCLFSAAKWRQPRPAGTHLAYNVEHGAHSEVKSDWKNETQIKKKKTKTMRIQTGFVNPLHLCYPHLLLFLNNACFKSWEIIKQMMQKHKNLPK